MMDFVYTFATVFDHAHAWTHAVPLVLGLSAVCLTGWLAVLRLQHRERLTHLRDNTRSIADAVGVADVVGAADSTKSWLEGSLPRQSVVQRTKSVLEKVGNYALFPVARLSKLPLSSYAYPMGMSLLAAAVMCTFRSLWGIAVIGGMYAYIVIDARKAAQRTKHLFRKDIPFVVDVLTIAVGSGTNLVGALDYVAREAQLMRGDSATHLSERAAKSLSIYADIADVLHNVRLGNRLCDELQRLGNIRQGETALLTSTLLSSERYGTSLADALERLSNEIRLQQERAADVAAQKLAVKLVFPLAGCILPAFLLLAVVPFVAGMFRSVTYFMQ